MWIDTDFHNTGKIKNEINKNSLDKERLSKLAIAQIYVDYLEKKFGILNPYFQQSLKDELSSYKGFNKEISEEILTYGVDVLKDLLEK